MVTSRESFTTSIRTSARRPQVSRLTRTPPPNTGANEASPGRYFEDYKEAQRIYHGAGMTIEEAEHASATRLYQNTAAVHFDAHAMRSTEGGKRLVYGGHVISVARALQYEGLENAERILGWNGGTHANPTCAGEERKFGGFVFASPSDRVELLIGRNLPSSMRKPLTLPSSPAFST